MIAEHMYAASILSSPLLGQATSFLSGDWDLNALLPGDFLPFASISFNCRWHVTAIKAMRLRLSMAYTFEVGTSVIIGSLRGIMPNKVRSGSPLQC